MRLLLAQLTLVSMVEFAALLDRALHVIVLLVSPAPPALSRLAVQLHASIMAFAAYSAQLILVSVQLVTLHQLTVLQVSVTTSVVPTVLAQSYPTLFTVAHAMTAISATTVNSVHVMQSTA